VRLHKRAPCRGSRAPDRIESHYGIVWIEHRLSRVRLVPVPIKSHPLRPTHTAFNSVTQSGMDTH
jgi:hypothetical protein